MANIIALEWDSYEARVVAARSRGTDVVIEHAFSVELEPRSAGGATDDSTAVGQRIAAALAARRIGRCDVLVAVGRTGVELRQLSLPPGPEEELPELVRFQAVRQFTTLGEEWPLDFYSIDHQTDGPRNVLAAAISPQLVGQIREQCEAAELRLQRIVLRPCAAASLVLRRVAGRSEHAVRMLVDVLTDEADITVTLDQTVAFMRTVRLPGQWNSAQQNQALFGEIRRTLAAAQNQLGGLLVEQIVLLGRDRENAELRSQVSERLELQITDFDPFDGLSLSRELKGNLPPRPGRFAPLLGMLLDECAQKPHAIDFLHPRRKPAPRSRRRLYVWGAATAAVMAVAIGGTTWIKLRQLDSTILARQRHLQELDREVPEAEQWEADARAIDNWARGDITWLDELARVSSRLPPPKNVRLTRLQLDAFSAGRGGIGLEEGGRMLLQGLVDGSETIAELEDELRDETHLVRGDGGSQESEDPDYPWQFNVTVKIDAPEPDPLARRPSKPN